jgi:branched-subunit amino acid transport protein
VLAAIGKFFGGLLPVPSPVVAVLNFFLSYLGVAVLFGLIFRLVPETKVRWRNVWLGALVTGLFFSIGKTLIGLYLGKSSVGSAYGAAGSVIVITVWVYYSAQIFFFGAEFTHAYTERRSPDPSGRFKGYVSAEQLRVRPRLHVKGPNSIPFCLFAVKGGTVDSSRLSGLGFHGKVVPDTEISLSPGVMPQRFQAIYRTKKWP